MCLHNLVRWKDESLSFLLNYRKLNTLIVNGTYPTPWTDEYTNLHVKLQTFQPSLAIQSMEDCNWPAELQINDIHRKIHTKLLRFIGMHFKEKQTKVGSVCYDCKLADSSVSVLHWSTYTPFQISHLVTSISQSPLLGCLSVIQHMKSIELEHIVLCRR